MTFPFSTHNYQLRFWMAAGGVDPDEDVRLVVLPPPYMVDSLAGGQVDAFCVGAPWNSIAVDRGVGHILHFVSDILLRAAEKVLAIRQSWSEKKSASRSPRWSGPPFAPPSSSSSPATGPRRRASWRSRNISASMPRLSCERSSGRLKIAPDGTMRESNRYLLVGREGALGSGPGAGRLALRPDGALGTGLDQPRGAEAAKAVFRPDLYDAALGCRRAPSVSRA